MPKVLKQVIAPGTYWVRGEPVTFTAEDCRHFARQGREMVAAGLPIRVPLEHQSWASEPVQFADGDARKAAEVQFNRGFVTDCLLDESDNSAWYELDIPDPTTAKRLETEIKFVSPRIVPGFTDGTGRRWENALVHVALTSKPVWHNQKPFGEKPVRPVALSLSDALAGVGVEPIELSLEDRIELKDGKWERVPAVVDMAVRWEPYVNPLNRKSGWRSQAGKIVYQAQKPGPEQQQSAPAGVKAPTTKAAKALFSVNQWIKRPEFAVKGGMDANAALDTLGKKLASYQQRGGSVVLHTDGGRKQVPVKWDGKYLRDAKGQPWGLGTLMFDNTGKEGLQLIAPAAKPPTPQLPAGTKTAPPAQPLKPATHLFDPNKGVEHAGVKIGDQLLHASAKASAKEKVGFHSQLASYHEQQARGYAKSGNQARAAAHRAAMTHHQTAQQMYAAPRDRAKLQKLAASGGLHSSVKFRLKPPQTGKQLSLDIDVEFSLDVVELGEHVPQIVLLRPATFSGTRVNTALVHPSPAAAAIDRRQFHAKLAGYHQARHFEHHNAFNLSLAQAHAEAACHHNALAKIYAAPKDLAAHHKLLEWRPLHKSVKYQPWGDGRGFNLSVELDTRPPAAAIELSLDPVEMAWEPFTTKTKTQGAINKATGKKLYGKAAETAIRRQADTAKSNPQTAVARVGGNTPKPGDLAAKMAAALHAARAKATEAGSGRTAAPGKETGKEAARTAAALVKAVNAKPGEPGLAVTEGNAPIEPRSKALSKYSRDLHNLKTPAFTGVAQLIDAPTDIQLSDQAFANSRRAYHEWQKKFSNPVEFAAKVKAAWEADKKAIAKGDQYKKLYKFETGPDGKKTRVEAGRASYASRAVAYRHMLDWAEQDDDARYNPNAEHYATALKQPEAERLSRIKAREIRVKDPKNPGNELHKSGETIFTGNVAQSLRDQAIAGNAELKFDPQRVGYADMKDAVHARKAAMNGGKVWDLQAKKTVQIDPPKGKTWQAFANNFDHQILVGLQEGQYGDHELKPVLSALSQEGLGTLSPEEFKKVVGTVKQLSMAAASNP